MFTDEFYLENKDYSFQELYFSDNKENYNDDYSHPCHYTEPFLYKYNKKNFLCEKENNNNILFNSNNYNDVIFPNESISILNINDGIKNTGPMTYLSKKTKKKKEKEMFKIFKTECNQNSPNNSNKNNGILFSNENYDNNISGKEIQIIEIKKVKKNVRNKKKIDYKKITNFKNEQKLQRGRKSKKDKKLKGIKGNHTQNDEDNIIYKIKSFFGRSLIKYLNNSLKGKEKLLKLKNEINRKLKRDYNLSLFDKTLKDIFLETGISDKYKQKDLKSNIKTINKIYSEKKENEVIKILNLTYYEAFEIFIRSIKPISNNLISKIDGTNILDNNKFEDIEILLEKIERKEDIEDIEQYKHKIINLCINFKQWFKEKIGREKL